MSPDQLGMESHTHPIPNPNPATFKPTHVQAVVDVERDARDAAGKVRGEEEAGGAHVVRVEVLGQRRVGLGVPDGVPYWMWVCWGRDG